MTYSLDALVPPGVAKEAALRVVAGTTDVVIRTRAATTATVLVRDPAGTPVVGAVVGWRRTDPAGFGDEVKIGTSLQGAARHRRFDTTASYAVHVEAPSQRDDLAKEIGPFPGRDGDTVLTIPAARTIRGVVRGPDGAPVSAAIWRAPTELERLRGNAEPRWATNADEQGRFTLGRLAPGAYLLVAASSTPRVAPPYVPVDAGADDVVLTLWTAPGPQPGVK